MLIQFSKKSSMVGERRRAASTEIRQRENRKSEVRSFKRLSSQKFVLQQIVLSKVRSLKNQDVLCSAIVGLKAEGKLRGSREVKFLAEKVCLGLADVHAHRVPVGRTDADDGVTLKLQVLFSQVHGTNRPLGILQNNRKNTTLMTVNL